jgi:hypothetical protein
MDGMTIAILLVGFGVWILSNVLKNAGAKNPPGMGPIAPRPRAAVNEIDRFLEEINRRRQQQQPPQQVPQAQPVPQGRPLPERPIPARPIPQAKPVRVEQSVPRAKPLPRPEAKPKVRPEPVRPQAIIVAKPVEPPPTARIQDVVPTDVPRADLPAALALKPAGGPSQALPRAGDSLAKQVRLLLRNRSTLRSVLVASEILGPPLCRRRRPISLNPLRIRS